MNQVSPGKPISGNSARECYFLHTSMASSAHSDPAALPRGLCNICKFIRAVSHRYCCRHLYGESSSDNNFYSTSAGQLLPLSSNRCFPYILQCPNAIFFGRCPLSLPKSPMKKTGSMINTEHSTWPCYSIQYSTDGIVFNIGGNSVFKGLVPLPPSPHS